MVNHPKFDMPYLDDNSSNHPLLFTCSNYLYWKNHMKICIEFFACNLWQVVENSDYVRTKIIDISQSIFKKCSEYTKENSKLIIKNRVKNLGGH